MGRKQMFSGCLRIEVRRGRFVGRLCTYVSMAIVWQGPVMSPIRMVGILEDIKRKEEVIPLQNEVRVGGSR